MYGITLISSSRLYTVLYHNSSAGIYITRKEIMQKLFNRMKMPLYEAVYML